MKGEEQPLRSTSKVVIPQPGLNLNGATKNQKEKRIGMLTVNSVSAFPLSSVIEFGTTRDLCSMEAPPSCM
jgi:hypothetical protein